MAHPVVAGLIAQGCLVVDGAKLVVNPALYVLVKDISPEKIHK